MRLKDSSSVSKLLPALILLLIIQGCKLSNHPDEKTKQKVYKTIGTIERIDPELDSIVSKDAKIEIIAEGHDWTEGPLWIAEKKMLLFSDIPKNSIYKWTSAKGEELYLKPAGYTGATERGGETGSNGLLLNSKGQLVLCQHGDRRMAVMNAPLDTPKAEFVTLADNYMGKKFDSPNDAVYRSNEELFFTDPPYGLEKNADDPLKEAPYQGVYKLSIDGKITLLTDSITRPNGIAFLPGESTLLVACSDKERAIWYALDLSPTDSVTGIRIFYNATGQAKTEKGLPDGMKVDKNGNVFATGPGGVWIFNKSGKVLGKFKIPEATSNCALADDEKTLYVTADMYVLRIKLR